VRTPPLRPRPAAGLAGARADRRLAGGGPGGASDEVDIAGLRWAIVSGMRTISSINAKTRFGQVLDAARRAPVTVTRKGRPAAVVLSVEDYERLRGAAWQRIAETMATAHRQAAERGLTDEVLAQLLADES
jgi:prevent-host-death family protein